MTQPTPPEPVAWMYEYTRKHPGQTKPGAVEFARQRHAADNIAPGWTETPLYTLDALARSQTNG